MNLHTHFWTAAFIGADVHTGFLHCGIEKLVDDTTYPEAAAYFGFAGLGYVAPSAGTDDQQRCCMLQMFSVTGRRRRTR